MNVPKFFDESHGKYYFHNLQGVNHTIRQYLGNGEHLLEYDKSQTIGSYVEIIEDDTKTGKSTTTIQGTIYVA